VVILFSLDFPEVDWCYLIWRYEMDVVVIAHAVTLSHLLTVCPSALLCESYFVPLCHSLLRDSRCQRISLCLRIDDHPIENVLRAFERCDG
jgi:hypothetical protein